MSNPGLVGYWIGRISLYIGGFVALLGMHGMVYSSQPEALRAYFRDKLGLPSVDVGDGWLIFDVPTADLGVHPTNTTDGAPNGMITISFFTDDLRATVAELDAKGVEFTTEIEDHGFGLVTFMKAPGDLAIQVYQPHYRK